jgi:hypothetical protein
MNCGAHAMSSHTMQTAAPCSLCNKHDHSASRCPELRAPLKEGFYTGGGVSRGHSDDDDEQLQQPKQTVQPDAICV